MKVSVVIPAYQSESTIGQVVDRIYQTFSYREEEIEVVGVDDGSRDDTFRVLIEKTRIYPSMRVIRLQENVGQQNALLCGIRQTQGDVIVTMDDDLQHPPEEIPVLLHALKQEKDLVYACSENKICSLDRSWGSKLRDLLFSHLFEKPESLTLHSFRAVNGDLARKASRESGAFFYLSAALMKRKPRMGNVTVALYPRSIGQSNYSTRKLLQLFMKIWIYYSENRLAVALRHKGDPYEVVRSVQSKGDQR
jgi:undecaprenyl-phosphate 4-deoxy-4-formamido-L-arabinose transferase